MKVSLSEHQKKFAWLPKKYNLIGAVSFNKFLVINFVPIKKVEDIIPIGMAGKRALCSFGIIGLNALLIFPFRRRHKRENDDRGRGRW